MWAANNAATSNTLTAINPSMINGEALSTEALTTIAEFINRPNVFSSTMNSPLTPPTPPTIHFDGYCYSEQPAVVYAGGQRPVTPP